MNPLLLEVAPKHNWRRKRSTQTREKNFDTNETKEDTETKTKGKCVHLARREMQGVRKVMRDEEKTMREHAVMDTRDLQCTLIQAHIPTPTHKHFMGAGLCAPSCPSSSLAADDRFVKNGGEQQREKKNKKRDTHKPMPKREPFCRLQKTRVRGNTSMGNRLTTGLGVVVGGSAHFSVTRDTIVENKIKGGVMYVVGW